MVTVVAIQLMTHTRAHAALGTLVPLFSSPSPLQPALPTAVPSWMLLASLFFPIPLSLCLNLCPCFHFFTHTLFFSPFLFSPFITPFFFFSHNFHFYSWSFFIFSFTITLPNNVGVSSLPFTT